MTARQKRLAAIARAQARNAKDREAYKERRLEEARQAGIRAKSAEEAKAALEAREAERARLRAEYDARQREESRVYWAKWHKEQAERDAANRLAAQDLADARKSEAANGPERAYCRLYVSADGGSDQPETPGAARCWLLPGHQGRCQPAPPKPSKGGRGLGLLLMAAALWSS